MPARRIDGPYLERVGDELLVYDDTTDTAHALNEAAAAVYEMCDGDTDIEAMVAGLESRDLGPIDSDIVWVALLELADRGLVELDERPADSPSRRDLLKRLTAGAAMAAAIPVVESIAAPSVAAASSRRDRPEHPTPRPSPKPSPKPTYSPTTTPTEKPSPKPTFSPTTTPTEKPTYPATQTPTEKPTYLATQTPTEKPTYLATQTPTEKPTYLATQTPTERPTYLATQTPTERPTFLATQKPVEPT